MIIYLKKVIIKTFVPDEGKELLAMGRPENYFKGTPVLSFPPPTNIVSWLHTEETISRFDSFHHRFIWVLNLYGECNAVVDHQVYSLSADESILVFPFQYHHFVPVKGERLWLFVGFESADPSCFEKMKGIPIFINDHLRLLVKAFMKLYPEEMKPVLDGEKENCDRTTLMLSNMIAEALTIIKSSKQVHIKSRLSESLSAKVQRWLYQHVGKGVRIVDAAHHFGLSESRLRARFKQEMGRSLGAVLSMLRYERARSLLTSTDLRISEIAEMTGYESVFAFSTSFKRRYKISPRIFRQQRH